MTLSAIVVAIKFWDDEYYKKKSYAEIGGVNNRDLNRLEAKFLHYLNYDLTVTPEVFERYTKELIQRLEDREIKGQSSAAALASVNNLENVQ